MEHDGTWYLMRRDFRSGQDDKPNGLETFRFDDGRGFDVSQFASKRSQIDDLSRFRML
jgi:hypothetical protein